jgi:putative acetyltransferase
MTGADGAWALHQVFTSVNVGRMITGDIAADDPRADDVRALLERHLTFANAHSPPEDVHALGLDGLLTPNVAFYTFRRDGELLGMGALQQFDAQHCEIKSMHTVATERGKGIARAMLMHLLGEARARGYRRVSLETGSMDAYAPARALYTSVGFADCGPFDRYGPSVNSTFMTLALDDR